jgi:nitrogen regulatory protein P-II 1
MKLITTVVRADKVDQLKAALNRLNVYGLASMFVRDYSPQAHPLAVWRGWEYRQGFSVKAEVQMTVHDDDVDLIVGEIIRTARTGQPGDGFVSVVPVEGRYSIRTGACEVS